MRSVEFSTLLHRALESRLARLLELTILPDWPQEPESVHQVRVASRRVRAVLDLADPERYGGFKRSVKRLHQLTEALGLTRELDVHVGILEGLGPHLSGPGPWAALEHVLERVDSRRRKARKVMMKELGKLELEDLRRLLEMKTEGDPQVPGDLKQEIWDCLAPTVEPALATLRDLSAADESLALHAERVRIKKLRYTLEILGAAFPDYPDKRLARLKALQTVLGNHHDHATLEARVQEILTPLEIRSRPVLANGVAQILDLVTCERARLFGRFRELTAEFPAEDFADGLRAELGVDLPAEAGPAS